MRHRRKNRSKRIDGYKRHVLKDLDTGLVRAVGITSANLPGASVSEAIAVDLKHQKAQLSELHSLSHIGRWQGDKARYIGVRKNLFDLRRTAVVHNLHVLARTWVNEKEHQELQNCS